MHIDKKSKDENEKIATHIHGEGNAQINIGTQQTAGVINNYFMDPEQAQTLQYTQDQLLEQSLIQLATYYKKFCMLKGVLEADRPYPLDAIFVQLVLITDIEQKEREQILGQEENFNLSYEDRHVSVDNIYRKAREVIDLKNIFDVESYKKRTLSRHKVQSPKTLLMMGCAGVGKTTLCNYIAYQWAENKSIFNHRFKSIIWIPLRQLNKNRYPEARNYELSEILIKESNGSLNTAQAKALARAIANDREQFLFLLDGYDELLPEASQGYLSTVFEQLSSMPYCIITSRPRSTHALRFDYQMEIMGFSEENVQKFTQGFFRLAQPDPQKYVETLANHLKTTPPLKGILQIPILLTMACELHARGELLGNKNTDIPKTMTDLYIKLVYELFKKFAINKKGMDPELCTPRIVQTACQSVRLVLEHLALEGLLQKKIIFTDTDLDKAIEKSVKTVDTNIDEKIIFEMIQNGLLRKTVQSGPEYYFIHLTFQEYFAACVVADKLKRYEQLNEQEKSNLHRLFSEHKYNPRFQMVWSFTAGLLHQYASVLQKFFELLTKFSPDILGFYERNLLLRCLEAAKAPNSLNEKKNILRHVVQDIIIYLGDSDREESDRGVIFSNCKLTLQQSFLCVRDDFFINEIVEKALNENSDWKKINRVIDLLKDLGIADHPLVLENIVRISLNVGSESANKVLGHLWKNDISPPHFKENILNALKGNHRLKSNAIALLNGIAPTAANHVDITRSLIELAINEKNDLSLFTLLIKIIKLEKSASIDELKKFVSNLISKALNTPGVKNSDALKILNDFCAMDNNHAMVSTIFGILQNILLTENSDKRYRAPQIIEMIAANISWKIPDDINVVANMIKCLVSVIKKDTDEDVIYAAVAAVGSFGPIAAMIPDVLEVMQNAEKHQHVYISKNATIALVAFKPKTQAKTKEAPEQEINTSTLSASSASSGRIQAVTSRQNDTSHMFFEEGLHEHGSTNNKIPVNDLISILSDKMRDKFCKFYALDALRQSSAKNITHDQLIQIGRLLLVVENGFIYREILDVLDYHCKIASIPEVIDVLLKMRKNTDSPSDEEAQYDFLLFTFFEKNGIILTNAMINSKIQSMISNRSPMIFLLIEKIVALIFVKLYASCFENENYIKNDPAKNLLMENILRNGIVTNIPFTLDDVTPSVLNTLDNALKDQNAIIAATVLTTLCKNFSFELFNQSVGFCLHCALHKLHVNIRNLLPTLCENATTEVLFELTVNKAIKEDDFVYPWLFKRLNALTAAIFIDPKNNAICIWEKGVLKRSRGLSRLELENFTQALCAFFNIENMQGISTHHQLVATTVGMHSSYVVAGALSVHNSTQHYIPAGHSIGTTTYDGNCLFDSVAQLMNNGQNADAMRQLAVNYMCQNREVFKHYFSEAEFEARIVRMRNSLEHADHPEIEALARALNRQIIIISNNTPIPAVGANNHPILFLHHESIEIDGVQLGHYQPFIPDAKNLEYKNSV